MENTTCTNDIQIVFEDEDILVINKPVGILSEDSPKGEKGILTYLQNENRKTIMQSLWDSTKAVIREKFIAIQSIVET